MFDEYELAVVRRAYAKQVASAAGANDPRIIEALAAIRRENFVPPGPWTLYAGGLETGPTSDADPLFIYQDVAIPLIRQKGLNTGQPSFVTRLIAAAGVEHGDRVVHIGCGTGYYTAILAHLVGPTGSVLGVELEPTLARRATDRFADCAHVRIAEADGWRHPLDASDVVFVSAGTSRIASTWLDALRIGGCLILPLAARYSVGDRVMTRGAVLKLERDEAGFAATVVSPVLIYPCIGADDPVADAALRHALEKGDLRSVTRLGRGRLPDGESCWLSGEDWFLA